VCVRGEGSYSLTAVPLAAAALVCRGQQHVIRWLLRHMRCPDLTVELLVAAMITLSRRRLAFGQATSITCLWGGASLQSVVSTVSLRQCGARASDKFQTWHERYNMLVCGSNWASAQ
jgi:hypothetical protein